MSIRSWFVGSFLSLAMIGAGPIAAAASWTVPGTVNASGLNSTKFVSDVTLTNPGTVPAQAVVSFLSASGASPKTLSLAPGQTLVSRNVVSSLFGLSGAAGAVSISSDQDLLVRARTYNTAASGTYGVSLPVFADDRLLSAGDTGDALWISQEASGSSGYRTNVALVFPDPSGGAATVRVYDADGNERGVQAFSMEVPGLQQFSVGSFAGAVSVARAQVVVTRGRAAGYAVVVDNVTGDSSLFAFEDLPGGRQDVLVNGVARANGRNGAFFRTDGRFYNPTDTDATIQISFHASGNANPSPASASFTLPAGKVRDVVDVLDTLLALPVGSAGALRFQSDWPVAILCRTSNVDPSGARKGTFGSQQKPVPLLSFVTSADAGAAITGIRQDTAFRTNVGFAAGADGATYALTLATADGATVATATESLGAFGWTQPGVQDLFPTVTIPPDATLRVKVTAGSLDVFDSSIDNLSGDPVVTPIAPLPVAIPSSATIGPQGGSIRSDDGRLTLRIPAGALSSTIAMSLETQTSNDAPQGSGSSYSIAPGGLTFSRPARLVFRYDGTDLDGSGSGALGLAFRSAGVWHVASGGSVDPATRSLTVPIASTGPVTSSAPSSRRVLADASPEPWAPFRSYQLTAGKKTLFPSGTMNLVVLAVGPSSSQIAGIGSFPLGPPASPSDLSYSWTANGVFLGDATEGTIRDYGLSAEYTAPRCIPQLNPVLVAVKLTKPRSDPNHDYLFLSAHVRILPRDWVATFTWSVVFICDGLNPIADQLKYTRDLTFSLDDDLNMVEPHLGSPKHNHGTPAPCPSSSYTRVERGPDGDLNVILKPGSTNFYRPRDDAFILGDVDVTLPVSGWKVTLISLGVEKTIELPKQEEPFNYGEVWLTEGPQLVLGGSAPSPFATTVLLGGVGRNQQTAVNCP